MPDFSISFDVDFHGLLLLGIAINIVSVIYRSALDNLTWATVILLYESATEMLSCFIELVLFAQY